ncbi:MAG: mobile mystery protein B [Gammaproteobacteria bacterium]|nr:mobile mystery protein B [Gammaproteobacteria bacterium]
MNFIYPPGATPIDPDEAEGLKPMHITIQSQLDEWEANNILNAENWAFSNKKHPDFLSIPFICQLHRKMFDETWHWAGKFRKTEKNIGKTLASYVSTDLKNLLDDIKYQLEQHSYPIDEIAYRFHHRLVSIHPFPNGNGRHARLMTDILLVQVGQPRFSWGRIQLSDANMVRKQYIDALKCADNLNYKLLAEFVRT